MVKEILACADEQGSAPGGAVFCFFVLFFFPPVWSLCFNPIFPLGLFPFILTAHPLQLREVFCRDNLFLVRLGSACVMVYLKRFNAFY